MVIIILEGKSSLKYLNWLWVEFLFFCGGSGGGWGVLCPSECWACVFSCFVFGLQVYWLLLVCLPT